MAQSSIYKNNNSISSSKKTIRFSIEQLEFLIEQFPALILNHTVEEARIREYFGTQKVIEYVRENTVF